MRIVCALLIMWSVTFSDDLLRKEIVIDKDTVMTATFFIDDSTTCIIKPGTSIKCAPHQRFIVKGVIIAEATALEPIVFSHTGIEKGVSRNAQWKGIEIIGENAHGVFRHCVFQGAFKNLIWESSPTFDSCTFKFNHYGLYCSKKARVNISGCTFMYNTYGIVSDNAQPLIVHSSISYNDIGLMLQLHGSMIKSKNRIIHNKKKDIYHEKSLGENQDELSSHKIWQVMNQLY